jgi:hypothetical protein
MCSSNDCLRAHASCSEPFIVYASIDKWQNDLDVPKVAFARASPGLGATVRAIGS